MKRYLAIAATVTICGGVRAATPIPLQKPTLPITARSVPCRGAKVAAGGDPWSGSQFKLENCVLARAYTLADAVLPAGSEVSLTKLGQVRTVRLSRAAVFLGQLLPAGSTVFFDGEERMRTFRLHSDLEIQGHLLSGREDGIGNSLHLNGKLRAIWLAHDETIDGVPCTSSQNLFRMGLKVLHLGTQRMAWFYDNGRLQQAMLSRDVTIDGRRFKRGDVVALRPDGKLEQRAANLLQ